MEETFSLAVPNLQINGHNYEEYLESPYFAQNETRLKYSTDSSLRCQQ